MEKFLMIIVALAIMVACSSPTSSDPDAPDDKVITLVEDQVNLVEFDDKEFRVKTERISTGVVEISIRNGDDKTLELKSGQPKKVFGVWLTIRKIFVGSDHRYAELMFSAEEPSLSPPDDDSSDDDPPDDTDEVDDPHSDSFYANLSDRTDGVKVQDYTHTTPVYSSETISFTVWLDSSVSGDHYIRLYIAGEKVFKEVDLSSGTHKYTLAFDVPENDGWHDIMLTVLDDDDDVVFHRKRLGRMRIFD